MRGPRRARIVLIALLALVVVGALAKIALTDQPWPHSRAFLRAILLVIVFGAVPLAAWLIRRRR